MEGNASFRLIPFTIIIQRIEKGNQVVLDLYNLVRSRLDVYDNDYRFCEKISRYLHDFDEFRYRNVPYRQSKQLINIL